MAIRERRTTHYEWTCDGPGCGLVERVFGRGERPTGWLTLKVTDRTTKAFHDKPCAETYFEQSLDTGLPAIDEPVDTVTIGSATYESPNRNEVDDEFYGANA